ncbi:YceD family protein [Sphingomonas sp. MS122]|uniref:YceD family protein n=1 Tax=Sphingomonas sp. MS122 TaxID=3412683 RepID=UPI003C2BA99E
MTPEFSRPHRLDTIGAGESRVGIEADAAERTALARRFGLIAIERLVADYAVRRDAAGIVARGHLSGAVVQPCSVTGDPVPAKIEEDFAIRFLPEGSESGDEVELSEDDCDTVFYTGGAIDLGEAAAETLALALDPFPRSPGAEAVLREAGVLSEDEAGPFAALAALRKKL